MIEFQDPRAALIAAQIEAINATGFDKPFAPVLEQSIFKGVVQNGEICSELFTLRFNEMVEEKTNSRLAVWAEQIENNISGIEWYSVGYGNIHIKLPRLHDNLKLLPKDKEILRRSKSVALDFLLHWHQVFQLWCYNKESDYPWVKANWSEFYTQYQHCEWLEIWVEDSIDDVLLLDGTCVERPNFAIHAYCYCHELSKVYNPSTYLLSLGVQFQWNNAIPYV